MEIVEQINHKLRHLRLISQAVAFVEYQTCEHCKRDAAKVSTPDEVSVSCECGKLQYWRVKPCE